MAILDSSSDSSSDSLPSSGSSSTEEDVGYNTFAKKRLRPSQSDSQEQGLEVPEELFNLIQEALALGKQLVTNNNDEDLIAKLRLAEHKIEDVSEFFKINRLLPSDWTYNPATAGTCVLKKFEKKKEKKKIKTKRGPRNPYIEYHPLVISELTTWLKFKEVDEAAGYIALRCISSKNFQRDLKPVEDDAIKSLIGDFAVLVFNNSYQMYVNKDNNKNVSDARFMECKYLKFETSYLFYMTIEAIEQGNLGVYKSAVEFKSDDGARVLDMFVLTDREPSGAIEGAKFSLEFTYETVKDGLTDPEGYYENSGMVRRRTKGGGYDYRLPFGWNGLAVNPDGSCKARAGETLSRTKEVMAATFPSTR